MTFVDTNVLLDLVTDDPNWASWSIANVEAASINGPLLINDIVYAELAVRYERVEDLEAFLHEADLEIMTMPRAALFLAGKVITQYRKAGDRAQACCLTFSSAPMQRSSGDNCSLATPIATAPISRR